jgi:hypothetical protein
MFTLTRKFESLPLCQPLVGALVFLTERGTGTPAAYNFPGSDNYLRGAPLVTDENGCINAMVHNDRGVKIVCRVGKALVYEEDYDPYAVKFSTVRVTGGNAVPDQSTNVVSAPTPVAAGIDENSVKTPDTARGQTSSLVLTDEAAALANTEACAEGSGVTDNTSSGTLNSPVNETATAASKEEEEDDEEEEKEENEDAKADSDSEGEPTKETVSQDPTNTDEVKEKVSDSPDEDSGQTTNP